MEKSDQAEIDDPEIDHLWISERVSIFKYGLVWSIF